MPPREPKLLSPRQPDGTYRVIASDGVAHYPLGTVRREDFRGPNGGSPCRWHVTPEPGLVLADTAPARTLGLARARLLDAWVAKRSGAARAHRLPGRFVVVEGGDGTGKTTLVAALVRELAAMGHAVSATEEPSRGPVGRLIRDALAGRGLAGAEPPSPQEWALLYAADRAHHLREGVLPALARGEVVVCSRYLLSSLAYQGATLGAEWVATVNQHAPEPDVYLFLDVPTETALARLEAQRQPDAFENGVQARAAAAGYARGLAWLERHGTRVVVLDGTLPPGTLVQDALAAVLPLLQPRAESAS